MNNKVTVDVENDSEFMGHKEGSILVRTEDSEKQIKNALPKFGQNASNVGAKVTEVSTEVLSNNLNSFLGSFENILSEQPEKIGDFFLDEFELTLGINASGGIELLGKLTAGAQAGIKIKLKRRERGQGNEK